MKKVEIWIENDNVKFETSGGWTIGELLRVLLEVANGIVQSDEVKILPEFKNSK